MYTRMRNFLMGTVDCQGMQSWEDVHKNEKLKKETPSPAVFQNCVCLLQATWNTTNENFSFDTLLDKINMYQSKQKEHEMIPTRKSSCSAQELCLMVRAAVTAQSGLKGRNDFLWGLETGNPSSHCLQTRLQRPPGLQMTVLLLCP